MHCKCVWFQLWKNFERVDVEAGIKVNQKHCHIYWAFNLQLATQCDGSVERVKTFVTLVFR